MTTDDRDEGIGLFIQAVAQRLIRVTVGAQGTGPTDTLAFAIRVQRLLEYEASRSGGSPGARARAYAQRLGQDLETQVDQVGRSMVGEDWNPDRDYLNQLRRGALD